jgi:hypothetical protein
MTNISVLLPPDSTVLTHVGDAVTFDTEIARTSQKPTTSQTIQIAESLKFRPSKIFKHLKKNIGDKIYKGDVVATKDAVFATKKYIADADGILTSVNHHSGEIVIEYTSGEEKKSSLIALLEGTVNAVEKDKIVFKTSKILSIDLTEAPKDRIGGKVVITDDTNAMQLTMPQISGKIIVSSDVSDYVLSKFEALGASYIIVTKQFSNVSAHTLILQNEKDLQSIIDFAPRAVYANAAEKSVTFYK